MKKRFVWIFISLCSVSVFADNLLTDDSEDKKISIGGSGSIMFGQIARGHSHGKAADWPLLHHWQNFYSGKITIISEPNEWFTSKIGLEVASAWPVLRETNIMKDIFKTQYRPFLPVASGCFHFNVDDVSFLIESGVIEYAFNPEVKNLGNYLYRSTTYPLNLTTKLDYIYSNLMGIRVQTGILNDQLKFGVIMNSITDAPPYFDMNLGFYVTYANENKLIDAGVGVLLERVIAINDSATDCISLKDQLGDSSVTMRGTKLDARVTFDPKKLFGDEMSFFGPNDGKIYVEGAVLGFNDPDYYNQAETPVYPKPSLLNRIPMLFGINVPTFKILDLLSVELEYCTYPYPFDWWGKLSKPSPKPNFPNGSTPNDVQWRDIYVTKDNLKWTFYLKKSISNYDIIAFAANDHIRYETFTAESHTYTEQSLRGAKNWHWYIKLQCNI